MDHQTYFDDHEKYGFWWGRARRKSLRELFKTKALLPSQGDGRLRVLDVGFGRLPELYAIADQDSRIILTGLEKAGSKMKSWARELKDFPQIKALHGDVAGAGLEEDYFDLALAFRVLHYEPDPSSTLATIFASLRRGGSFCMSLDVLNGETSPSEERLLRHQVSFTKKDASAWSDLLRAAGWAGVENWRAKDGQAYFLGKKP